MLCKQSHENKQIRKMTRATIDVSIGSLKTDQTPSRDHEHLDQFANWFARSRNTLHYMADLILNNSEMAEHAVENCKQKASQNLPGFESEGEFRGWIFRVLINEALTISPARY
jgi:DNA-directed RNA polymerase specialized sigma24 family protein